MVKYFERFLNKFINVVEKGGNALPHPAALFGILGLITVVVSAIGNWLGWQGTNPANGQIVSVVNLISVNGLHRILLGMVNIYTGFAPLGIVMVALLGIGVAESSGVIKAVINALLLRAPSKWITFIIVFAVILSNLASHLGYLLNINMNYYVMPTANFYFMAVSTFVIAFTGTWITNTWVEPRLGMYTGEVLEEVLNRLSALEKKDYAM
jgi:aminobenzoyl-glutamate transport protein